MSISVDKNSPRINKCIVVKSASSDIGSIKITLAFHRRRKTAYRMAYPPVVPVAHIVDPDDMLKLLDRIDLTPAARIEQLLLHPCPHTLTSRVIMASSASTVHALGDLTRLLKKVHESSDSPYDVVLCIGMESIFGEVFAEDAFELFVQSETGSFAFKDRGQSSAGFVFDQYFD